MPSRDDFITKYGNLPAFRDLTSERVGEILDNALAAIGEYQKQKVKLKNIPVDSNNNGVYDFPEDAYSIVRVLVSNTNIRIDFEQYYDEDGNQKFSLGNVRLPSYIGLVENASDRYIDTYENNSISRSYHGGTSYSNFDLLYSKIPTFESLDTKHELALRLYAEYSALEEKSTITENVVDIVDRDATGASTTIRNSNRAAQHTSVSQVKYDQFLREMRRPYWSRSGVGIIERIWRQ